MERDDVIKKVQDLWRLADHPNTPPHERDTAVAMANKLMAKYQIDELILAEAKGTKDAVIFKRVRLSETGRKVSCADQRAALANECAKSNRCAAIIITGVEDTTDVDTGKRIPGGSFIELLGYQSDIAMVEALFTSLAWALIEALMDEEVQTQAYQESFATGFVERIRVRLAEINRTVHEMAEESSTGMEIVLRDREHAVEDFFTKKYPNVKAYKTTARHKFDPNAAERGRRAANAVDVGATKIGGDSRGKLGPGE